MASWLGNKNCSALALFIVVSFCTTHADGANIGVCYGMRSDSFPSHNEVVNLLKSNNIGKVKLYVASHDALQALNNSGIEVIVGVGDDEIKMTAGDQDAANAWVNDNISPFFPSVNIKYIAVGIVVSANTQYISNLLRAMRNIQTAVNNANLQNDIKVSTPHAMSVLNTTFPPSQATFGGDMSAILEFLSENGSPFMAQVYPYFSYKANRDSISADYALFRSTSTVVNDEGRMYKNLFDAMVDSFVSAMEKQGQPNIPIVITETGWPSAGSDVATVDNAQTYNNNLIKHVLSNAGTPKRPGRAIETYIFALFNENQKDGEEVERHFGLFETNKTSVYPLVLSPESLVLPPEGSRDLKVVFIILTVI